MKIDRGDEAFLSGGAAMLAGKAFDAATRAQFALNPCALDDPVVMRAKAQVRHLVLAPEVAFGTDEVRAHVARWLEAHPKFPSMPPGPSRDDWLAITGEPANVGQIVNSLNRCSSIAAAETGAHLNPTCPSGRMR